jgi:hypothetical protein
MKLKAVLILLLIILSLLPAYALYQYLQRVIQPKESMRRFLAWLIIVLTLIFVYTFLVVFIIRLLFPQA